MIIEQETWKKKHQNNLNIFHAWLKQKIHR